MPNTTAQQYTYPQHLPISGFKDAIVDALGRYSVIIICGETGSGKTTQIPKMALEVAGDKKKVACTQPRRVAAMSVAERVAKEINCEVGAVVGYQHRYDQKLSASTRIKFMTDGILLSETMADKFLENYSTIIIDEAHERSLNIDFLLGILKRILEKRKDLKVIISSATLDTERFSCFFPASKTIIVPGKTYPVEVSYLYDDDADDDARDLPSEVARAIRRLPALDDILVFLPGERDIRETADKLARDTELRKSEIIPLYASLPAGEIKRAFKTLDKRRIILSTNVAETSLTIPGIKAVVDSGLARISRYIHRTHVQRLQIERISKASARQRAGRCGRIAPGKCIRLYSEEDYNTRDEFTAPEILRSSLAGVVLTMLELRLGSIETFPFVDMPKPTMIREGLRELLELGAIYRNADSEEIRLTKIGRRLAKIPLAPRLSRMLLAASDLATLPSALPIVAAMGCDNPRKRPVEQREKADAQHAKWRVKGSDFLGTLSLWKWWEELSADNSTTQLRKTAAASFLSYQKMREWKELVLRLEALCRRLGLDTQNDNGGPDQLHRALLPSLLSRIGKYDHEENNFRGAHGIRFAIHPSSVLSKKFKGDKASQKQSSPEWVMASEIVDTSKLFAREAAVIDPAWLEPAAGNICKHSYYDAQWDAQSGFVRTKERVTLYGLVIADGRRRDMSRIDPLLSRRIFILHALVYGEFPSPPPCVKENIAVISELRKLADKMRSSEIFDADALAVHFENTLPKNIVSASDLRKWVSRATDESIKAFTLNRNEWLGKIKVSNNDYPPFISIAGTKFRLAYNHSPDNADTDGITCTAKRSKAKLLTLWNSDWLVPGMLPEKISWILKSLPAQVRRTLPPVADTVAIILPILEREGSTLKNALCDALLKRFGVRVSSETVNSLKIPDWLKIRFVIRDDTTGEAIAVSRSLTEALAKAAIDCGTSPSPHNALSAKHFKWDFGNISFHPEKTQSAFSTPFYKALHDEGDGVCIKLFKTEAAAIREHERALARLICLELAQHAKREFRVKNLSFESALYFKGLKYDEKRLADDIFMKGALSAAVQGQAPVFSAEAFTERVRNCRAAISAACAGILSLSGEIIEAAGQCSAKAFASNLGDEILGDITTQLAWLVFPGFISSVPLDRLKRYPRYLKALDIRIARAKNGRARDIAKLARFEPYWEQYKNAAIGKGAKIINYEAFTDYRWMLEEYRISLFAQELGTAQRVSPEILSRLWIQSTNRIL